MNQETKYQEYPKGNREHKSSLFCKVFEEKKYLLELYNSVNGTNYQNEEELEVNTLENVVYISMKNDISFLIDCNMNLYEHQSTYNPNMPLRGLLYFAQLYNKYIAKHNLNVYSSSLQKIPVPQYVVFYNGTQEQPDEQILLLSEAFQKANERQHVDGCLECQARMLNINYGHNRKLMEKCRRLEEYAIFVTRVRQYTAEDAEKPESAITRAVEECIEEGILADILSSQKAEVLELVLTTFNRELYEQGLKDDAVKEAVKEVEEKAAKEIKKAEKRGEMKKTIEIYQEFGKSKEEITSKLIEDFRISKEEADETIRLYWKV